MHYTVSHVTMKRAQVKQFLIWDRDWDSLECHSGPLVADCHERDLVFRVHERSVIGQDVGQVGVVSDECLFGVASPCLKV